MKTLVCRCEDLTLADCEGAIDSGYRCFEDLKRFLGLGTGPCQGKACVQAAMHLIAARTGVALDDVDVMTFRPPVRPIEFRILAAGAEPAELHATADAAPAAATAQAVHAAQDVP